MSAKERTLALLADIPETAPIWSMLDEDARLLLALAEAEAEEDIRDGRERPLETVQQEFEAQWTNRRLSCS